MRITTSGEDDVIDFRRAGGSRSRHNQHFRHARLDFGHGRLRFAKAIVENSPPSAAILPAKGQAARFA